jgi:6-phosphogluconate dehydrogenase
MQVGMIGLGRMGANLVRRLHDHDHRCVAFDRDPEAVSALVADGVAVGADSIADLVGKLDAPRVVWVMVPAGVAGMVVAEVAEHLEADDIVIDGGNSHYPLAIERAAGLAARGVHFVDVGTSGGLFGLERGYCLMVGGEAEPVSRLEPILRALAPGSEAAPRTRGRSGESAPSEQGFLHCGPPGAGHFVKMVHNGIEYAVMAAYAEGMSLLSRANVGAADHPDRRLDADRSPPLGDAERFQYDLDVAEIAELWRRGSVISSWLLDLTAAALHDDPKLDGFEGRVADSGEGRWTVLAAIESGTPTPTIADALFGRFASRGNATFTNRMLSAMRAEFGGHREAPR